MEKISFNYLVLSLYRPIFHSLFLIFKFKEKFCVVAWKEKRKTKDEFPVMMALIQAADQKLIKVKRTFQTTIIEGKRKEKKNFKVSYLVKWEKRKCRISAITRGRSKRRNLCPMRKIDRWSSCKTIFYLSSLASTSFFNHPAECAI